MSLSNNPKAQLSLGPGRFWFLPLELDGYSGEEHKVPFKQKRPGPISCQGTAAIVVGNFQWGK